MKKQAPEENCILEPERMVEPDALPKEFLFCVLSLVNMALSGFCVLNLLHDVLEELSLIVMLFTETGSIGLLAKSFLSTLTWCFATCVSVMAFQLTAARFTRSHELRRRMKNNRK